MTQQFHNLNNLGSFLGNNDAIARLNTHSRRLAECNAALDAQLPLSLRGYCVITSYSDGHIKIRADGGGVATKLRQMQETLREVLNQQGFVCKRMDVRVGMSTAAKTPPKQTQRPISSASASAINGLCHSLAEDDPLRQALQRLLERSVRKPD